MHWAQASLLETSVAEVSKNTFNTFSIKLEKGFLSFTSPWIWKTETWKKLLLEQVSFDCKTEKKCAWKPSVDNWNSNICS